MKKLMIIAASAFAALLTQGATVDWSSDAMKTAASKDGGWSSTAIKKQATAYLFSLTETEYNTFLSDYTSAGNMKTVWSSYKDKLSSATATGTSTALSKVSLKTDGTVGKDVFGAIIYTYKDADLGDFYIANIAKGNIGSEAGITIGSLATYYLGDTNGTATGGWQSVPEPTSGLLLLLGFAGLALKRKNA